MSATDKEFQEAAAQVKNLKVKPIDEELLDLYALFKQATDGDINIPKPGMFALKEKAKWEWWNKKKGMDQEEAKLNYIHRVKILVEMYGLK